MDDAKEKFLSTKMILFVHSGVMCSRECELELRLLGEHTSTLHGNDGEFFFGLHVLIVQ